MQYIYKFGKGCKQVMFDATNLLGGKGANLAEIAAKGIPVPYGFTIPTLVCKEFIEQGELKEEIISAIEEGIKYLESKQNKVFGGGHGYPLLISVRSGAPISMPGMMDTVLNVGLNDQTVEEMGQQFSNTRFAYDSYRRLLQMFGETVLEIEAQRFNKILMRMKQEHAIKDDCDIPVALLKSLVEEFKQVIVDKTGEEFPQDVKTQLLMSVKAVFKSWNSYRACKYREIHEIPNDIFTAVNIQSMVFGNLNNNSATGVLFTRDPNTGENHIYGEYLKNAQGEDVVAGIRSPLPLNHYNADLADIETLEKAYPTIYDEITAIAKILEKNYCDMQDIEFTIENGKLWILQTRAGKRTAAATIQIAYDLFKEGIISFDELAKRITSDIIEKSLHITIDNSANLEYIGTGLAASPGAATGIVVFDAKEAEKMSDFSKVILVRPETSPEDIGGMHASAGILTACGGMTSHAAVVARGMGKSCITAANISIDTNMQTLTVGEHIISKGEIISIDGSSGKIYLGEVPTVVPQLGGFFTDFLQEFSKRRAIDVLANADTVPDIKNALELGAQGIGLCRTEHMFFGEKRVSHLRQMIFALNDEQRLNAINQLLQFQIDDFSNIFKTLGKNAITVRLLDPPLHEFMPCHDQEISDLAISLKISPSTLQKKINALREVNPMLGHRGCRLGITSPEVYKMQVNAIITSAILAKKEQGFYPNIKIMIPLISDVKELVHIKDLITTEAEEVTRQYNQPIDYTLGTMIELPRAAIMAAEIAQHVDFFAFGTNDLTQTTYGISRDDAIKFTGKYLDAEIFMHDPFVHIDKQGVGKLIEMAMELGKKANPNLKCGICGEHGGDPLSIEYFKSINMDYISCSPFRIPIACISSYSSTQSDFNKSKKIA